MNPEHTVFKDFSGRRIRNKSNDRWLYSVVDFIQFAINQDNFQKARKYWNKLKERLKNEGEPVLDKLIRCKLTSSDGKERLTDAADLETLIEIIRLTPSPNRTQLLQDLGFEITKQRKEFAFGNDIVENLFSDYTIIKQQPVLNGNYRIDWYIPELKLAIEYDESSHNFRREEDINRQQAIEAELGSRPDRARSPTRYGHILPVRLPKADKLQDLPKQSRIRTARPPQNKCQCLKGHHQTPL